MVCGPSVVSSVTVSSVSSVGFEVVSLIIHGTIYTSKFRKQAPSLELRFVKGNMAQLSLPQAYISSAFFFFPERLAMAKFIRISMTQKTGVTCRNRCV